MAADSFGNPLRSVGQGGTIETALWYDARHPHNRRNILIGRTPNASELITRDDQNALDSIGCNLVTRPEVVAPGIAQYRASVQRQEQSGLCMGWHEGVVHEYAKFRMRDPSASRA